MFCTKHDYHYFREVNFLNYCLFFITGEIFQNEGKIYSKNVYAAQKCDHLGHF